VNQKQSAGKRNLTILIWFALACQLLGWAGLALHLIERASIPIPAPGNPLGPVVAALFGLAIGGWAGNLREITELKERMTSLEGRHAVSGGHGA
jgi:hypothetical protein